MERGKISIQRKPKWWKESRMEGDKLRSFLGSRSNNTVTLENTIRYASRIGDSEENIDLICMMFHLPFSVVMAAIKISENEVENNIKDK